MKGVLMTRDFVINSGGIWRLRIPLGAAYLAGL